MRRKPRQIVTSTTTQWQQWKLGKVESVTLKGADDRDVQMWIVYPPDFDPKKKWPLVQVVHGGPHNGITTDFSFRWNLQLWARQGYVVGVRQLPRLDRASVRSSPTRSPATSAPSR